MSDTGLELRKSVNIPLDRIRVGSRHNSINPQTGQPEFFDPWGTKGYFYLCDEGAQTESCEGWVPNFLKDKPGTYMPTPEDLARLPDAQKEQYARYYEGTGGLEDVLGTALPGVGRLYSGARNLLLRGIGKAAGHDAPTREEIAKAYRGAITNPKPRP